MGYQIQYVPEKRKEWIITKGRESKRKIPVIIAVCAVLLGVAVAGKPLRDWISPGDPEVTDRAVAKMVESLQSGDSLREAASVFCMEVLEGDIKD